MAAHESLLQLGEQMKYLTIDELGLPMAGFRKF